MCGSLAVSTLPAPFVRLRLQRYYIEKPISSILWVVSWGVLA